MSLLHEMFEEEAERYYRAGDEPDLNEIAERILNRIQNYPKDQFVAALTPITHIYLRQLLRNRVLRSEKQSLMEQMPIADPTGDRIGFLTERFYVPGVGFVSWAEATIPHHKLRVEYLEKKVSGIEGTIARHMEAVNLIEQHGVSTLGEVYAPPKKRPRRRAG